MTVIATAGHVDHGKTTVPNFLTEQEKLEKSNLENNFNHPKVQK